MIRFSVFLIFYFSSFQGLSCMAHIGDESLRYTCAYSAHSLREIQSVMLTRRRHNTTSISVLRAQYTITSYACIAQVKHESYELCNLSTTVLMRIEVYLLCQIFMRQTTERRSRNTSCVDTDHGINHWHFVTAFGVCYLHIRYPLSSV